MRSSSVSSQSVIAMYTEAPPAAPGAQLPKRRLARLAVGNQRCRHDNAARCMSCGALQRTEVGVGLLVEVAHDVAVAVVSGVLCRGMIVGACDD